MNAFQNIGLREYCKRYGTRYAIFRGLFLICPIHFLNDYANKKNLYFQKVHRYIKRNYSNWKDIEPVGLQFTSNEYDDDFIWIYWKQGLLEAPKIVNACITSVKNNSNKKVIVLSDQNLSDYIIMPEYINNGVKNGNISIAAYSDVLRFSLLEHYGGTWIDGTVLLTGSLPGYITESELFAYRDSCGLIYNPALMSVWLIHCIPHNNVIKEVRNILFEYWKHNKYIREYLLSNIVFTLVLENNPRVFDTVPYANSDYCYLLQRNLGCQFEEKKNGHIREMSAVHKLTYKLADCIFTNIENFYNYIVI